MTSHFFCALSVGTALLYFFIVEFVKMFFLESTDTFFSEFTFLFVFIAALVTALTCLLWKLFPFKKNVSIKLCLSAFLVGAMISFVFRDRLFMLADIFYVRVNEKQLLSETTNHSGGLVVLRRYYSYNFSKLIIYSSDGLSNVTVDNFQRNNGGFIGCQIDWQALWRDFYLLKIYC
jgi:hypothetical protein